MFYVGAIVLPCESFNDRTQNEIVLVEIVIRRSFSGGPLGITGEIAGQNPGLPGRAGYQAVPQIE
jgi:hypothetical protein